MFMCNKTFIKYICLKISGRAVGRRKMSIIKDTGPQSAYDNAVKMLNSLQSINTVLTQYPKKRQLNQVNTFLNRCNVSDEDLDKLSVIHVAGTKGKGSTCAFCEKLLSTKGYCTGLFTSPHLISVKERFRINGKVISDDMFVFYFWNNFNALLSTKKPGENLPSYFVFLTIMAFTMFIREKVDVAIIETGVGGEYDSTNILRKTSIVGITSLGLDHTTVLGNSLKEIAWQKSGIMKPNSVTIVINNQPKETIQTLIERSIEKQSMLLEAPSFNEYNWNENTSKLRVLNPVQQINTSLAIQLANAWINRNNMHEWANTYNVGLNGIKQAPIWKITNEDKRALQDVHWLGRNQIINVTPNLTYFLDGAHTIESIQLCSQWYLNLYPKNQMNIKNILIFNVTKERDYSTFLKIILTENKIDLVLLCPIVKSITSHRPDTMNINLIYENELMKCHTMKTTIDFCNIEVFNSIEQTIKHVEFCSSSEKNSFYRVLITGSLKLVGGVLEVLQ